MYGREGSTRRPCEGATGEEVDMKVGNGFAGVGTIIDDNAVTGVEV